MKIALKCKNLLNVTMNIEEYSQLVFSSIFRINETGNTLLNKDGRSIEISNSDESLWKPYRDGLKDWKKKNRYARIKIMMKCFTPVAEIIESAATALNIWNILIAQYFELDFILQHEILQNIIDNKLINCCGNIDIYIKNFVKYSKQLIDLKHQISVWIIIFFMIVNLNGRFKKFKRRILSNEILK